MANATARAAARCIDLMFFLPGTPLLTPRQPDLSICPGDMRANLRGILMTRSAPRRARLTSSDVVEHLVPAQGRCVGAPLVGARSGPSRAGKGWRAATRAAPTKAARSVPPYLLRLWAQGR